MSEKLKTVDIKGKAYVEVNERIRHFRENFKGYQLTTDIVSISDGVCIMKANIIDDKGVLVATGHAYEKEGNGFINKTSYIENCETSAWGRALGNLGIGITTSIASGEEVSNAIHQQDQFKSIKANLPSKLKLECPNDEKLLKDATTQTLTDLGFKNWRELDFSQISEIAFIETFRINMKALGAF